MNKLVIMNKFNRILLTSGLAATASLMANSAAFAGQTQGTVQLGGTVPSSMTMTLSESSDATELALEPGNEYTDVKVASITGVSTNSANGLQVVLTSNWALTSGSNSIAITILGEANGSGATYATSSNTPSGNRTLQITKTNAAGIAPDSSIFIGYNVPLGQAPGNYTGSIIFTASDK